MVASFVIDLIGWCGVVFWGGGLAIDEDVQQSVCLG